MVAAVRSNLPGKTADIVAATAGHRHVARAVTLGHIRSVYRTGKATDVVGVAADRHGARAV